MSRASAKDRTIYIACDFVDEIFRLFDCFHTLIASGWLDSKGYRYIYDHYKDIFNCFKFDTVLTGNNRREGLRFEIILKNKPFDDAYIEDCKKMHTWTDQQIVDYLKKALINSIEEVPGAFKHYSDFELKTLINIMDSWEITFSNFLPRMTYEDLVKLIGHDFEYVK